MQKLIYLWSMTLIVTFACSPERTKMKYPQTYKDSISDNYFGTLVEDPYRWLEDDNSSETRKWVEEQNKLTDSILSQIPYRKKIERRLTELWDYPKEGAPFKKGDLFFQYKNDGLQNQNVLYVKTGFDGLERIIIDPNKMSSDGTVALSGVYISDDAKYAAYTISKAGSDWQEAFVRNIETGEETGDHLMWLKFSGLTWNGNGFYYNRFPEPLDGDILKGENKNCQVYYHRLGTLQKEDILIYEDPEHPDWSFAAEISSDKNWLFIHVTESTSGNALYVLNLQDNKREIVKLISDFESDFLPVDFIQGKIYLITNAKAPNYKVVAVTPGKWDREAWQEVIPEKESVLVSAKWMNGKLISEYLKDASSAISVYEETGKYMYDIDLPFIGSVSGFSGDKDDTYTFYSISSFSTPGTIYKYNLEENKSELISESAIKFNCSDYETTQVFYTSKDGTKIPMFLTHKKGLKPDGKRPTLLYGYGGFNISLTPVFSVTRLIWLENNGILAVANLRGGGEYGENWHLQGTKLNKQNVFDDFIAAGEYLIKQKFTSSEKLTIQGGSNGGLLIGAVTNQRPDLMAVSLPAVGVMDMLRYHKFTIGRFWATDYGTSEESEEMFKYLFQYSPVHSVKQGTKFPAILVTTADHDDRVVPAHSFKYISTIQEKGDGISPTLIRIETNAGHGAGKPTSKVIAEYADLWSFAFWNMGIEEIK